MSLLQTSTNKFSEYKWIVNSTAGVGTHTTITAAIASASSGDVIFITPGTYTESFTLTQGVCLTGATTNTDSAKTIITGTVTFSPTAGGTSSINSIQLQTASAINCIVFGNTGAGFLNLVNCLIFPTNGTSAISYTNSNSGSRCILTGCKITGDSSAGANIFSSSSAGELRLVDCFLTDNSTTASTASAGIISVYFCREFSPITTSGTSTLIVANSYFSITNLTVLTIGGSGSNSITESSFVTGTASAISVGSNLTISECSISSSNTNAITGGGTLTYGGITFTGSSSTINTTTQVPLPFSIQQGGTASSSFTAYAPITGGTTTTGAFQSASSGISNSGYVLTSNGSSSLPTWQAHPATSFPWTVVTGATQTLAANNGYFNNASSGTTVFTLPAACSVGDTFAVVQMNSGSSWKISQNTTGQIIQLGSSATSSSGGILVSTAVGNSVTFVCSAANTNWVTTSVIGNITVA